MENKDLVVGGNLNFAMKETAHQLFLFSRTIDEKEREYFFHPMNKDLWVKEFCNWLSNKQKKSAEVRASND